MTRRDHATLERIVPTDLEPRSATGRETLELHVASYEFAVRHLRGGRVLDLACGVGYGSALIATLPGIEFVVGGDISIVALRLVHEHYRRPRIVLGCGDQAGWLRPGSFDGIVSLGTVEHVPDPIRLMQESAALLKPSGVLIASVPVTPSVDANPHHRTDFTPRSFLKLGERSGFEPIAMFSQVQPFSIYRVLTRQEERTRDMRHGLLRYYAVHPAALWRRLFSTVKHGFTNHYLTVVWQKRKG